MSQSNQAIVKLLDYKQAEASNNFVFQPAEISSLGWIYPDADHGFFCHERSSHNQLAAEDA